MLTERERERERERYRERDTDIEREREREREREFKSLSTGEVKYIGLFAQVTISSKIERTSQVYMFDLQLDRTPKHLSTLTFFISKSKMVWTKLFKIQMTLVGGKITCSLCNESNL
jgi:hypothetical protein